MRILMITGRADYGGGPEHVYRLAKELHTRAEVFIASPCAAPYRDRFAGVVSESRMLEIPHRRFSLTAFLALCRFVRRNGIEIVHAHGRAAGIYGRLAAVLTGRRCIYTPHGGTPVSSARTLALAGVEYLLSLRTDRIIAVSNSEAAGLRRLCSGRSRLKVVPNGVELPSNPTAAGEGIEHPMRVIHATRFVPQKNSGLLLPIMRALRGSGELERFKFVILGDGPGRTDFESAVNAGGLQGHVEFKGAVPGPQDILRGGFCLLSTSRWEGMPLVVLEAMALGLPVIATDVAGNRDAVADGRTGFLYDGRLPEDAAAHLLKLAADRQLWSAVSMNARKRVEECFSVRTMAESTMALYRAILPPCSENQFPAALAATSRPS